MNMPLLERRSDTPQSYNGEERRRQQHYLDQAAHAKLLVSHRKLLAALCDLVSRCDDVDSSGRRTLSTDYVRGMCEFAIAKAHAIQGGV